MAKQRVTVVGLPELKTALAATVARLNAGATMAVAEEVNAIRDDARRIAPRDTGDLESHIDAAARGAEGTVKSTSRHAGFVEHGTYKDAAQPYMEPAAQRSRMRAPKRFAEILRTALGV